MTIKYTKNILSTTYYIFNYFNINFNNLKLKYILYVYWKLTKFRYKNPILSTIYTFFNFKLIYLLMYLTLTFDIE